jgi:hypothetical protein
VKLNNEQKREEETRKCGVPSRAIRSVYQLPLIDG